MRAAIALGVQLLGGTGGSGGSSGTGGYGGSGGSGGTGGTAGSCSTSYEPNDSDSTAYSFGTIGDCDAEGGNLTAALSSAGDQDFYTFDGTDGFCVVDPTAYVSAPVRLCMFASCNSGGSISCIKGASSISSSGMQGCCVPSGGEVELVTNCSGSADDAKVVVRVDQANQCTPYTLNYHF